MNKTNQLCIRMTEEERALLERCAERRELMLTSYVRSVLMTVAKKDDEDYRRTHAEEVVKIERRGSDAEL